MQLFLSLIFLIFSTYNIASCTNVTMTRNNTVTPGNRTQHTSNRNNTVVRDNVADGIIRRNEKATKKTKPTFENYYRPYWDQGELVFNRSTIPTQPATYAGDFYRDTPNVDKKYHDCDIECPEIHDLKYKQICGARFLDQTKIPQYRYFDSMCELRTENCRAANNRPLWFVIHQGFCDQRAEFVAFPELSKIMYDAGNLVYKIWTQKTPNTIPSTLQYTRKRKTTKAVGIN